MWESPVLVKPTAIRHYHGNIYCPFPLLSFTNNLKPTPLRPLTLRLKPLLHNPLTTTRTPQHRPLQLLLPRCHRIRSIQSSIIRTIRGQHLKLNRLIALSIRTLLRSNSQISLILINTNFTSLNILPSNNTFEDFERSQGLIEGNFVAGFVDAGEGEESGLFYLAVDYGIGGRNVGIAGEGEIGCVYFVGDDFSA